MFDKGLIFFVVNVDKVDFGVLSIELFNYDFINIGVFISDEYIFVMQVRILCVCIRRLDYNQMLLVVNDKNIILEMWLKIFILLLQIY